LLKNNPVVLKRDFSFGFLSPALHRGNA
jgi:hypothetical protein